MPELDVIIVSHGDGHWLDACLSSLDERSGGCAYEVVVVENGPPEAAPPPQALRRPRIRCMRVANRGFAAANNAGLRVTANPFVLFLNPDTQLVAGTLADAVAELAAMPEVGLLATRQLTSDGAVYPSLRRYPSVSRALAQALGSERWPLVRGRVGERILDRDQYERARECDWTTGAVMLARRDALVSAGDFDERFFLYCEETDLCLRITQAGWRIMYSPHVGFVHHAGKAGVNARREAQAGYARAQYAHKHFSRPRATVYRLALALGEALRVTAAGGPATPSGSASLAALQSLLGLKGSPFQPAATVADRAGGAGEAGGC
ncbi:MAG TPA: glycosyltransferase family 2 protein [Solirubrobacteraceae bacterium]|nr:glycosyltransferase family 2 protein [Solirubrobacteraceae bacterium]